MEWYYQYPLTKSAAEMFAPSQCIQAVIDAGQRINTTIFNPDNGEVHVLLAVLLAPSATPLVPVPFQVLTCEEAAQQVEYPPLPYAVFHQRGFSYISCAEHGAISGGIEPG